MSRHSSNFIPKYRKHRASGQAIVTLCGVDHYLGPHGTQVSRRQYDRLVAEWLESGRSLLPTQGDEITVVELCARYWKFAKGYYVKDGRCTKVAPAIKIAIKYVNAWYGKEQVNDFGPLALKAVRQRMVDDGLSRCYINDHTARIVRMFKWAVGEQLVSPDVQQALALVPGLLRGRTKARETAPVLPVEEATIEATLPHLPATVADMVRFQRLTGCRPAEVCIVRPCDLDRSSDVWTYRPSRHKTERHGRDRTIFVGPKAQAILLRYLVRDAETHCFCPADSEVSRRAEVHASRKTPLSCGNKPGSKQKKRGKRRPMLQPGNHYTTDSYRSAITRVCEKHGIEKWSPNRLRHSAATEIRKEFGLEAAQVILGHSSADVSQIYAERDLAKGAEVARRIG